MMKNTYLLYILTLLLCALPVSMANASAGLRALNTAAICPPAPQTHSATLNLQYKDQNRMELAKRFYDYLEAKGQDPSVITSIYRASITTDVDFELLLLKAMMESDLGRMNVAATSTARGVFQYIEPTWITLIHRYGEELGYPHYAAAIGMTRQGIPYVKGKNPYLKAEILALRHDADMSALIKAYQIIEETDVIRSYKQSRVSATDHYIVHMLGLGLAKEFYDLKNNNSIIAVARLGRADMREAARLNRIFFYKGKHALTARDSYRKFEARVAREYKKIYAISKAKEKPACDTHKPATILVNASR